MDGLVLLAAIVAGFVILGLTLKIALLNSRLQGYREAKPPIITNGQMSDPGVGCFRFFAVIGFVFLLGLCIYIGISLAG